MTTKILGNSKPGRLYILSAPAGTGKTTLMERLTKEFSCVIASVSYTTREPRIGEIQGVHYNFVTPDQFQKMVKEGDFLEHVDLFGYQYGTSKKWVEEHLNQGYNVVLVIDTQGAALLKGKVDAVTIFLSPPSLEELEKRLVNRKTDNPEVIQRRLARAVEEMAQKYAYDYSIVNDDLEVAYQVFRSILIAEEHKIR